MYIKLPPREDIVDLKQGGISFTQASAERGESIFSCVSGPNSRHRAKISLQTTSRGKVVAKPSRVLKPVSCALHFLFTAADIKDHP